MISGWSAGVGGGGKRQALIHKAVRPPPSLPVICLSLELEGRQTLIGGRRGTIVAEMRTTTYFCRKWFGRCVLIPVLLLALWSSCEETGTRGVTKGFEASQTSWGKGGGGSGIMDWLLDPSCHSTQYFFCLCKKKKEKKKMEQKQYLLWYLMFLRGRSYILGVSGEEHLNIGGLKILTVLDRRWKLLDLRSCLWVQWILWDLQCCHVNSQPCHFPCPY